MVFRAVARGTGYVSRRKQSPAALSRSARGMFEGAAMEPLQREPGAVAELPAEPEAKLDVLMLLRLREQMKQQLVEHSAAVHASQESYPDHAIEEKLIKSTTEDLEREEEKAKVSFQNKTLVLQRLILETMKHVIMLSTAILESQQQAREMEQKLNDIKRKRLLLKQAGRQKLLQIHTMMKKQKKELVSMEVDEMLEKICNKLQKEREMTT
ncbi:centromere protein H-like isoform X2 [Calonectris borealis]|uniref:centromere protein H-like isoform X2 n=1 Tax=Calonectris borealis TaxID=1323832 RepID=UPI003F4B7260